MTHPTRKFTSKIHYCSDKSDKLINESEQYQQVITVTQRVLEIDPCSESAHRSAMIAFAELGDRAGVVRQYEKCKKSLLDDLGVAPSSQTETLYKTLMK